MKNVFTEGGHDNLHAALVGAAMALLVLGVLAGVHLFMKGHARTAGLVASVAFAGAVISFIFSTDAVLVDSDARVDAFVNAAKSSYGVPLTHEDGENAYRAYRSGDDKFEANIQGGEYLFGLTKKGDDLVLMILGSEPRTS